MVMPIQSFGFDVGVGPTGVVENEADELDEKVKNRGLSDHYLSGSLSAFSITLGDSSTGEGIKSTSISKSGAIYAGVMNTETEDEVDIYKVDKSGDILWKKSLKKARSQALNIMSLSSDGTIYAYDFDSSDTVSTLWSLSPQGDINWFRDFSTIFGSFGIDEAENIYLAGKSGIKSINENGNTRWEDTSFSFITSDIKIGSDGVIYLSGVEQSGGNLLVKLKAFEPNGTEKWSKKIYGTPASGQSIARTYIVPGANDLAVHYVEEKSGVRSDTLFNYSFSGTKNWEKSFNDDVFFVPEVRDDNEDIFGGTSDGEVWKVDGDDGQKIWSKNVSDSGAFPLILSADGKLYINTKEEAEGAVFSLDVSTQTVEKVFQSGDFTISLIPTEPQWLKNGYIGIRHDAGGLTVKQVSSSSLSTSSFPQSGGTNQKNNRQP